MINVSQVLNNPNLSQEFTVSRSSGGEFTENGWVEGTPTQITMRGVVTVAAEKDLVQVPEGDRVRGAMVFYAPAELYITHGGASKGTSDVITWRGESYRVASVKPYGDYGYWKAVAVRTEGD